MPCSPIEELQTLLLADKCGKKDKSVKKNHAQLLTDTSGRPKRTIAQAKRSMRTVTVRPPISLLFITSTASLASSGVAYLTVPKPLCAGSPTTLSACPMQ